MRHFFLRKDDQRSTFAQSVNATALLMLTALTWQAPNTLFAEPLPAYEPQQPISGVIRNYGNGYGGVLKKWEAGFQKFHPDIKFEDTLPTSDAAFPALITNATDLAPNGSEPALTETLGFYEVHGYHATAITVASGSFDVEGRSPGVVVFVHKDNPITHLSLEQLDCIFGAQRNSGLRGFNGHWKTRAARNKTFAPGVSWD